MTFPYLHLESFSNFRYSMLEDPSKQEGSLVMSACRRVKFCILTASHTLLYLFEVALCQTLRGLTFIATGLLTLDKERFLFGCRDTISIPVQLVALLILGSMTCISTFKAVAFLDSVEERFSTLPPQSLVTNPVLDIYLLNCGIIGKVRYVVAHMLEGTMALPIGIFRLIPLISFRLLKCEFSRSLHLFFQHLGESIAAPFWAIGHGINLEIKPRHYIPLNVQLNNLDAEMYKSWAESQTDEKNTRASDSFSTSTRA